MDFGPKVNEVEPDTQYLIREFLDWVEKTTTNASGRDYFGTQTIELVWEAGQLVEWRGPGFKRR